ncbi:interferon regulatory factor 2-binding protein 2-like [Nyctibius grandis]|uniref:interferon regulatory factor 2-binding protein 2-like n=1 Tax=Nyctibius grandis TaxID=48427 RepID=UPI0035BBB04F
MAALAGGQVPGGAAAAAIRPPPSPLRYILVSGYERPGHGSRKAAGKMAAASAPYAKYPPPPPLRPPGGKGKRVGFKPPPPPAQTPSSLPVSVSRARHRRDRGPCDPPDSRLLSPRPDRLRPQAAHIPAPRRRNTTPAPDRPSTSQWSSLSLSAGAVGQPTAQPAPACQQNTGDLKSPLPLNRALPLPFAARGGVPNRAPMPPPRAPSLFWPQRKKPHRAASILKNDFLPQELAPNVPWR